LEFQKTSGVLGFRSGGGGVKGNWQKLKPPKREIKGDNKKKNHEEEDEVKLPNFNRGMTKTSLRSVGGLGAFFGLFEKKKEVRIEWRMNQKCKALHPLSTEYGKRGRGSCRRSRGEKRTVVLCKEGNRLSTGGAREGKSVKKQWEGTEDSGPSLYGKLEKTPWGGKSSENRKVV